tara:strand:- start:1545 stop:1994 length:450 start_codon:yes stop_codon:yes gene_type:complete
MYQAINQRHLDRLRNGIGEIEHNAMSLITEDVNSYISIPSILTSNQLVVLFDKQGNVSTVQIDGTLKVLFNISKDDDFMFAEVNIDDTIELNTLKCFYVTCVDRARKLVNLIRMDNSLLSDTLNEKLILALSDTKIYREAMLSGNQGND